MKRLIIIVPVYNEEEIIEKIVKNLLSDIKNARWKVSLTMLVVNDGSSDNTQKILEKLRCNQLHLPSNLGIGGAVQAGFKFAKKYNYDYAVQFDGDGQHNFSEIENLLKKISETNHDFVVGSRLLIKEYKYDFPIERKIGIYFSRKILSLTKAPSILDVTSGFRICNKKAISLFASEYPIKHAGLIALVIAALNNLKISEVGCKFNYRSSGKSFFSLFAAINYVKDLILIFFGLLMSK